MHGRRPAAYERVRVYHRSGVTAINMQECYGKNIRAIRNEYARVNIQKARHIDLARILCYNGVCW